MRQRGYGPDEAQDYTQGFFAHMIEKQDLCRADPNRGRFRSFLLAMLKHFAADTREQAQAQKRGGGIRVLRTAPRKPFALHSVAAPSPLGDGAGNLPMGSLDK